MFSTIAVINLILAGVVFRNLGEKLFVIVYVGFDLLIFGSNIFMVGSFDVTNINYSTHRYDVFRV